MPEESLDELMTTETPPPGGMPANAYVAPTGYWFGSQPAVETSPAGDVAPLGPRVAAGLIDAALVVVVAVVAWLVLIEATASDVACGSTVNGQFVVGTCRQLGVGSPWPWIAVVVVIAVLGGGYAAAMAAQGGQTLGMRVGRVRLVDATTGAAVSSIRSAGHFVLAAYLAVATLGLSWLALLWDPRQRSWHDRILDTQLVAAD